MKKYIGFILILLVISCTTEDTLETPLTSTNLTITSAKESVIATQSQQRTIEDDIEIFRLQMEWAAFITAEILAESNEVAPHTAVITDMDNAIAIYGSVIPLKELLGTQSNYPNFKVAFRNKFLEYYIGDCRPNFGVQRPPNNALISDNPPPPTAPNTSQSYYDWAESFTVSYLHQITNVNCVELYMPNGLNYGPSPNAPGPTGPGNDHLDIAIYTTGAHPLTTQTSDGPGWRMYPGKPKITLCQSYIPAGSTVLSTFNTAFDNVIIARPYRDQSVGCNYISINVDDFTLYLD